MNSASRLSAPSYRSNTPAFESANQFLGWGDVQGGLWFVGFEEGTVWSGATQEEIVKHYGGEPTRPFCDDVEYTALKYLGPAVRKCIAQLTHGVSRMSATMTTDHFRRDRLWKTGSHVFQTNLFPVAMPPLSASDQEYRALFGYSETERAEYESHVTATRFPALRALWEAAKPQATICLGTHSWPYCRKLFALASASESACSETLHVHERERVIMVPLFTTAPATHARLDHIAATLRRWNVSIP